MELLITTSRVGSLVHLTLCGEIDVATAGEVRDAVLAALCRSAPATVVLDFRLVSFIDSTGIGVLVSCHRAASITGAELRLTNLAPFARRQLWASGLLGLFGLQAYAPEMMAQHDSR